MTLEQQVQQLREENSRLKEKHHKMTERQQEALSRAQSNTSMTNYSAIYRGFMEKGIAQEDIRPRENVFTLFAWNALGRRVRKGEHGVHVITFVEGSAPSKNPADVNADGSVKVKGYKMARTSTVFHLSQTEPTT